jgi:prepilin-type N-terminal cleavage/methylation domain-containing protein
MKKKNKGFTIIEILMVLAIIGILSAVVTTNLRGVKDKARINKALQFSQGLYTSLGSNTALHLDFENTVGGIVTDRSENKNDASLLNGASIIPAIVGSGVSFDGVNDYLDFNFSFFNTPKKQFTTALWVYPNTTPAVDQIILHNLENNEFMIGYDSTSRFFFAYSGLSTGWQRFTSKMMLPGKWYHVAVNWDEKNNISQIFIDGSTQNTINPSEGLSSQIGNPVIGAQRQGVGTINNFNGFVDDVRIYNWD